MSDPLFIWAWEVEPDKDSGDLNFLEECGSDRKLPHVFGQKKGKSDSRPCHVFVMGGPQQLLQIYQIHGLCFLFFATFSICGSRKSMQFTSIPDNASYVCFVKET